MKPYYETPEYFREWRRKNPDKVKAQNERTKMRARLPENILKRKQEYLKNKARYQANRKAYYLRTMAEHKAKAKQWRVENPERAKANKKAYYAANCEALKQKASSWYYEKHDHCQKRNAAYRTKTRQHHRAYSRSRSAEITDGYAREMLSKYSTISARDWPQALVDAKKLEIACMRLTGDKRYKALPETTVNKIKNP